MINSGSPLAVLMASLIVMASGATADAERSLVVKPAKQSTKLRAASKLAWRSAIINDDAQELRTLLESNDPQSLLTITANNGKSALMVAAKKGDETLAKKLVKLGVDINETTETQGTPFMFAVLGNHQNVARWLLEQGADIDRIGSNGWTALTIAAAKGQVSTLQWLIGQGANAQVRDVYRFTPLLRAVDNGYIEAVNVLLSLVETDVNAHDEYGNTALHHAVAAGNMEMVELLLEHHADPSLLNRDGVSPADIARSLASDSHAVLQALEAWQEKTE